MVLTRLGVKTVLLKPDFSVKVSCFAWDLRGKIEIGSLQLHIKNATWKKDFASRDLWNKIS